MLLSGMNRNHFTYSVLSCHDTVDMETLASFRCLYIVLILLIWTLLTFPEGLLFILSIHLPSYKPKGRKEGRKQPVDTKTWLWILPLRSGYCFCLRRKGPDELSQKHSPALLVSSSKFSLMRCLLSKRGQSHGQGEGIICKFSIYMNYSEC